MVIRYQAGGGHLFPDLLTFCFYLCLVRLLQPVAVFFGRSLLLGLRCRPVQYIDKLQKPLVSRMLAIQTDLLVDHGQHAFYLGHYDGPMGRKYFYGIRNFRLQAFQRYMLAYQPEQQPDFFQFAFGILLPCPFRKIFISQNEIGNQHIF